MIRATEQHRIPTTADLRASRSYDASVVTASDGTELFVRHYRAAESATARTLFVVHGMSEHGGRYEHVAQTAVNASWNVVVTDLRGHGRSGGVPTHIDVFNQYIDDLKTVRSHFGLRPDKTAILGHSMGGLVLARMLQQDPTSAGAVVLTSPLLAVKVEIPLLTMALGRAVSLVYPQKRFRSRVDQSFTTRNLEVLERRTSDPYIHRSVTAGWYFAMEAALKQVWREASSICCPILLLQAGADYIVDPEVAEPWLDTVSSTDKMFRMFPEHYHELLNEPDWPVTVDSILNWLDTRITV